MQGEGETGTDTHLAAVTATYKARVQGALGSAHTLVMTLKTRQWLRSRLAQQYQEMSPRVLSLMHVY